MSGWLTVALVCLATHRVTRWLTSDRMLDSIRAPLQDALEQRWVRRRAIALWVPESQLESSEHWQSAGAYFVSCAWCVGAWVSAVVVVITDLTTSVPSPVLTWLAASTVTGLLERGGDR